MTGGRGGMVKRGLTIKGMSEKKIESKNNTKVGWQRG